MHFATAWEQVADLYPNRNAVICDQSVTAWGDFERRAACVAGALEAHGLAPGSKAALYLHNSNEYQEAQFGIFKIAGCPINVNYRYKADELVYLLDNADAEAVFYQACYAMRIWEIKERLPKVKVFIQIDDRTESLLKGSLDYERCIRDTAPLPRREQDNDGLYMLYTGGTTGLPKGVMYSAGEFVSGLIQMGATARELEPPTNLDEYREMLARVGAPPISLPGCPLMHGTGVWLGSFLPMFMGGTVVTTAKLGLDPDNLLGLVEHYRVTDLIIVGDAFAKPILVALDDAAKRGNAYDLSSLKQITSSGVMWSQETKLGLLRHHDMVLADIMGSTEGGMGSSVMTRDGDKAQTAKFELMEGVRVITDDDRFVEPGSVEIGKLATSGSVPLGYYKDPEKSAATFREVEGVRYAFPGDYATVEADGSITLLGRGSACINTGGEKVFPEEVEEAVKRHPAVFDCLVVGVPDERFGEKVVAVASLAERAKAQEGEVVDFTREQLAGYKVPKQVLLVAQVRRAPNGKADYKWAMAEALKAYGTQ